jgi:hypothetical protein
MGKLDATWFFKIPSTKGYTTQIKSTCQQGILENAKRIKRIE